MSKKNGFTLIEILVVIVIIGALVALLYPMVINVANRSRKTVLANKIQSIELAAAQWAQSFDGEISWVSSNCQLIDYDRTSSSSTILVPCEIYTSLTVQDLIDSKFLSGEKEGEFKGKILNPIIKKSTDENFFLNDHNVTIQKYYGQYYGIYQE